MKVICDREKLLAAFQTAAAVAPLRSPKPILQNVKFDVAPESATMLATDLEIGIRVAVPGIEIQVPGSAVLPIHRFGLILRESSDARLHLETDGQGTTVRGDRSEFKLPAENPDEFPTVSGFAESKFHELPARLFKEVIRRTVFATDTESSRYALGGVLVELSGEKVVAVGTDGRRLAMMEGPAHAVEGHTTGDATTIIPTKAMQLIERSLTDGDAEVQLAARPNDVLVRSPRVTIYSRLVEGRFPKWRDVFPRRSDAVKIELVVGPVYSAVRQAAIVTSEESRGVDFSFADGKLVLSGQGNQAGQSRVELPIAYDGAPLAIMLDPRYVTDFLKVLDAEKTFTIEIKDAESAAVCSTDDGYGYVIMPLARDR
ncbi:MAG TPA: DNA polymerase III subunit beta [Pirellulales bacterium]|jgi:DNA polymerase-3 subunit beta|nr:DNA polymerase III subunit beta [Pirellulales bacterium]